MKSSAVVRAVAVLVLLAGSGPPVILAQHGGHEAPSLPSPAVPLVQTGKVKGKVVEFSQTSITVETQRKGWAEKVTYLLGASTKTKGSLEAGADVIVKYREDRGMPTATSIEVKKRKQAGT